MVLAEQPLREGCPDLWTGFVGRGESLPPFTASFWLSTASETPGSKAGSEQCSSLLFPRAQNINHLCQMRSKCNMMKWSRYLKRFYKDLWVIYFQAS